MKSKNPVISVCIPLFETEMFLAQCLESVLLQDYDDFEVIIVNDASYEKDEHGHKAKKIVCIAEKSARKQRKERGLQPVEIRYIEHHENRGLIEVRRTLVHESKGSYITMLDSDDVMEAGALKAFAANLGPDIIHGTSTAGTFSEDGSFIPSKLNRYGAIFYGRIEGREIFRRWLINNEYTSNTWGKLIKRELFESAYENIPYTECNMAEDVLLFFFISQHAQSYLGIKNKVYRYRINTGMSSARKIDSLTRWKMICSTAGVFTILSSCTENLQPDEVEKLRSLTRYYLANNIKQMQEAVIPELQPQARKLLCDYWGESFVNRVEEAMS